MLWVIVSSHNHYQPSAKSGSHPAAACLTWLWHGMVCRVGDWSGLVWVGVGVLCVCVFVCRLSGISACH